jgi:type III restriction enzyme
MQIKFDSNQTHQLEPIKAVLDIFDGQIHLDDTDLDEIYLKTVESDDQIENFSGLSGFRNLLTVENRKIFEKCQSVQKSKGLDIIKKADFEKNGLNFTIDMETGTGKTYVYLRTVFELNKKYGFKKFIIVVPNVAVREGVLKNLEITKVHFKNLYEITTPDFFVYDSDKLNYVYNFVSGETIQIMIINIQAFNKETAIFNQPHYKLNGYSPQRVINETSPIVIIDEPQIIDNTEKGKDAIKSLNPLFVLRYSATHKELYNQIHSLTPIDAFEQGLVKQIQVVGITSENEYNSAYIKLLELDNKNGIRAKIRINRNFIDGAKKDEIWVKAGDNLFNKSGDREEYLNGFEVMEIMTGDGGFVELSNDVLRLGDEIGGIKNELVRTQIKSLILSHFEKQRQVDGKLKVLSLIFLDKVNNYRIYDESGNSTNGLYANIFEEEYNAYIEKRKIKNSFDVNLVHDGYFSQDKTGKNKGIYKDTKGDAKVDADTYNKIMKDKERLLSMDEPLQFIFSHSALGVGWDNPNVFQICTLNETNSSIKKRQEIGRGLRLPVDINGERVRDEDINILTVITNESYTDFANKLQKEFEDDSNIIFGRIKRNSFINMVQSSGEIIEHTSQESEDLFDLLNENGFINENGKILKKELNEVELLKVLPLEYQENTEAIINKISDLTSISKFVKQKSDQKIIKLKYSHKQLIEDENFSKLWSKISQKTNYRITINSDTLIQGCVNKLNENLKSVNKIKITKKIGKFTSTSEGITTEEIGNRSDPIDYKGNIPNLISLIKNKTELKRETIKKIIKGHNYLDSIFDNPQEYVERTIQIIQDELKNSLVNGISYHKLENEFFDYKDFKLEYPINHQNYVEVKNSIYDNIVYDNSNVEKNFANWCEKKSGKDGNIKLYFKIPSWFKIETPVGTYNPDWAIVWDEEPTILYLVRETKSTRNISSLRGVESDKISCAKKHFEAISPEDVSFYDTAIPDKKDPNEFDICI